MKKKRSIKNIILKSVMSVIGFICMLSACALDSPTWIPTIVFVITFGILAVFALANDGWVKRNV